MREAGAEVVPVGQVYVAWMPHSSLRGKLNFRQLALLRHALKHPRFSDVVQEHRRTHGISNDAATKNLLEMADKLKLLLKTR